VLLRSIKVDGAQHPILGTPVNRKTWELQHGMIDLGKELGAGAYELSSRKD
uniref:Uncharacterized protein n=1 Tax=Ditylenchus dipsaci TaxID=166011 RepID=A0A915CQL9_9BILA